MNKSSIGFDVDSSVKYDDDSVNESILEAILMTKTTDKNNNDNNDKCLEEILSDLKVFIYLFISSLK